MSNKRGNPFRLGKGWAFTLEPDTDGTEKTLKTLNSNRFIRVPDFVIPHIPGSPKHWP